MALPEKMRAHAPVMDARQIPERAKRLLARNLMLCAVYWAGSFAKHQQYMGLISCSLESRCYGRHSTSDKRRAAAVPAS